ncbi:hypothetical protein ACFY8S_01735 [Streptomyces hygroscopicus]|uniref:hypothetical protein n=1 Tax=Streptomyces hygroscopicus TaxID=1912 RepID=UPI0036A3EA89
MTDYIQPDDDETEKEAEARIREELRRRGVGPGGPAASPPPMPPHPPVVPSQSATADGVQQPGEQATQEGQEFEGFTDWLRAKRAARQQPPAPEPHDAEEAEEAAPARAANGRLPHWWERKKPNVGDLDAGDEEESGEEPALHEEDEEAAPEPKDKSRDSRPARRPVSKASRRPPADELGEEEDDDEDDEEEQVPAGPRWSRPALGRPPGLPPERRNLVQWWREVAPEYRWLLYHGTGLGAGVYFGVFTYGMRGAEFVTQQGLGDPDADVNLGLLGLVLVVDYRVRNLFPPLAWAVRAISTSLVIGAAWNGTPLADISN